MSDYNRIIGLRGLLNFLKERDADTGAWSFAFYGGPRDYSNPDTLRDLIIGLVSQNVMTPRSRDFFHDNLIWLVLMPDTRFNRRLTDICNSINLVPRSLREWKSAFELLVEIYLDPNTTPRTQLLLDYAAANTREMLRRNVRGLFNTADADRMKVAVENFPNWGGLSISWPTCVYADRLEYPDIDQFLLDGARIDHPAQDDSPNAFIFGHDLNAELHNPINLSHLLYPYHWLSPSSQVDGAVTYHRSITHFIEDRQTRTTLGRYMTAQFKDVYRTEIIARFATHMVALAKPPELKLATTEEEITRVYVHGPNSCMSKGESDYRADIHPASVYATPDLAVAYLTNGLDTKRPVARAVVNVVNKEYGRLYGDSQRLITALQNAGFTSTHAWLHCTRIKCIPYRNTFIGPYIDMEGNVYRLPADSTDTDPKYLLLTYPGKDMRNGFSAPRDARVASGQNSSAVYGTLRSQPDDGDNGDGDDNEMYCEACDDQMEDGVTVIQEGDILRAADGSVRFRTLNSQNWCESCAEEAHSVHTRFTATGNVSANSYRYVMAHDAVTWVENVDERLPTAIVNAFPNRYVHLESSDDYVDLNEWKLSDPDRPVHCAVSNSWIPTSGVAKVRFSQLFDPARPDELLYFADEDCDRRDLSTRYAVPESAEPGLWRHPHALGLFRHSKFEAFTVDQNGNPIPVALVTSEPTLEAHAA